MTPVPKVKGATKKHANCLATLLQNDCAFYPHQPCLATNHVVNPLSPSIHIQILQADLHTFP